MRIPRANPIDSVVRLFQTLAGVAGARSLLRAKPRYVKPRAKENPHVLKETDVRAGADDVHWESGRNSDPQKETLYSLYRLLQDPSHSTALQLGRISGARERPVPVHPGRPTFRGFRTGYRNHSVRL